jgi:hypothetical protein
MNLIQKIKEDSTPIEHIFAYGLLLIPVIGPISMISGVFWGAITLWGIGFLLRPKVTLALSAFLWIVLITSQSMPSMATLWSYVTSHPNNVVKIMFPYTFLIWMFMLLTGCLSFLLLVIWEITSIFTKMLVRVIKGPEFQLTHKRKSTERVYWWVGLPAQHLLGLLYYLEQANNRNLTPLG